MAIYTKYSLDASKVIAGVLGASFFNQSLSLLLSTWPRKGLEQTALCRVRCRRRG